MAVPILVGATDSTEHCASPTRWTRPIVTSRLRRRGVPSWDGRSSDSPRYSELSGWEIDSDNPMTYGMVQREGNVSHRRSP